MWNERLPEIERRAKETLERTGYSTKRVTGDNDQPARDAETKLPQADDETGQDPTASDNPKRPLW